MNYSIQNDIEGEMTTTTSLLKAIKIAIAYSIKHKDESYYITKIYGGDWGDVTIAEYRNGNKIK